MSRDATQSSNGFFYQRLYFCNIILEKIKEKNDNEIKLIKCLEEGKIDGNEYEDFTFIINNKIISYQIKYKSNKESITKESGFIKAFIPYFDKKYNSTNIEEIYYIVSKNKTNETSKLQKVFAYFDDPELIYKYLILLASENSPRGDFTKEKISVKYDEVKDNFIITYDDKLINKKINNKDNNKDNNKILFEKFKKSS